MRWYHFTGISDLRMIVNDCALLGFYERLKREFPKNEDRIMRHFEESLTENEREAFRSSNVFLTPKKSSCIDAKSKDVRLCFELDREPNYGVCLAVPHLDLDFLVEVAALKPYMAAVEMILHSSRKYYKIPVVELR